ncbi:MAG: MOSC domain-containing protein [SAR202 cluster bacterium]|nr:MOSC domain-containing protein [SAR202 cluster bacterium]|tara:strand:- start:273 stop:764 length:492 start_codon:yes stop_codon:yes gene_type:complete
MDKIKRGIVGKVISVNSSDKGGIPKIPQEVVEIYEYGVKGDYHSGKTNFHAKKNNLDRQITIIAQETIDFLNKNIGEKVFPGSLGENILIHGFGDLSDITDEHIMEIGSGVILKINGQNQPCSTLNSIDDRILKLIVGKRGLISTVKSTGIIKNGDKVKIYKG